MADVDNANFLQYLKQHKPYLYDIEMQVRQLQQDGGFGDISVMISMAHQIVDRGEIVTTSKRLYVKRQVNRLSK